MATIFWNVDTQYDFMRTSGEYLGKLGIPGARSIEENLERLTRRAAQQGIKVVNTADWHTLQSREISDTPDFKTTFPPHCLMNTKGAEYVPATRPVNPYVISWQDSEFDAEKVKAHRNIVLLKDEFDIFHPRGGLHTEQVLKIIRPDRAIVYGVATNVCVHDAVVGLRKQGIDVYIVEDAIKELPGLPLPYKAWRDASARLISLEEVVQHV